MESASAPFRDITNQTERNHNADIATDNKRLQQKLQLSEEWCARLQKQIQQLLQLPYNETEKLKDKMNNPEIAIPLLQCYDAAIREKEDENSKLAREIDRLRQMLRNTEAGGQETVDNARLAEETARATMMRAESDVATLQSHAERLATENASLKERLMAMADAESRLKASSAKDVREIESLNDKLTEQTRTINRLNATLDDAHRKLRMKQSEESTDKNSSEAQKIQLHLMTKENEDKVLEIDRLRNKMVQALKTAAENHTTHMKIVEEKHKNIVNAIQDEVHTHEVTILKLRAQLSRLDVFRRGAASNGSDSSDVGYGGGGTGGGLMTTTQTMQQHALEIQEIELKRLSSEVTSLTIQRDEALFRVERLTAARRDESTELIRQLKKDIALVTARCSSFEERNAKLDDLLATEKEHRRIAKDEVREAERQAQKSVEELEAVQKELYSAKLTVKVLEEKVQSMTKEWELELAEAEKRVRLADRRTDDVQKDGSAARDNLLVQLADAERSIEDCRNKLRDTNNKFNTLSINYNDSQRALEMARLAKEQLTQSLAQHRQLISAADERLNAYIQQEAAMKQDLREMAIEVERQRLELIKCSGERDRALKELTMNKRFKM